MEIIYPTVFLLSGLFGFNSNDNKLPWRRNILPEASHEHEFYNGALLISGWPVVCIPPERPWP